MSAGQWVILLIVVVAVALVLVALAGKRRRDALRERFGPEYDRAVAAQDGNARSAESELRERQRRHEQFEIKELEPAERDRYAESWRRAQLRFVDEPETAIVDADRLVMDVMRARGYPVENFEQRAADLSVEHPVLVQNYRAGHEIAERHATGQASTEDLRQAMVHYRALFEELLGIEAVDHDADTHVGAAAGTVDTRDERVTDGDGHPATSDDHAEPRATRAGTAGAAAGATAAAAASREERDERVDARPDEDGVHAGNIGAHDQHTEPRPEEVHAGNIGTREHRDGHFEGSAVEGHHDSAVGEGRPDAAKHQHDATDGHPGDGEDSAADRARAKAQEAAAKARDAADDVPSDTPRDREANPRRTEVT